MGTTEGNPLGRAEGFASTSPKVGAAVCPWLGSGVVSLSALACISVGCVRSEVDAGAREPEERLVVSSAPAAVSDRVAPSFEPAAVVELFTSEGCAACPRADEFVAALDAQAERNALRIFVLAFHVHYWNELGHVDRFSAPRYTERQQWYAAGWGTTRVYTPQFVIGGTEDVSGNDRRNAILAISEQLDQKPKVGIALTLEVTDEVCHVRYEVEPPRPRDYLTVALVQDRGATQIEAGENAGRLVEHVNIVRDVAWSHVGSGLGTWSTELPSDLSSGAVVAFVQQARTRRVVGASEIRLERDVR